MAGSCHPNGSPSGSESSDRESQALSNLSGEIEQEGNGLAPVGTDGSLPSESASNGGNQSEQIEISESEPEREQYVIRSEARRGHKRELEFALRSLTEFTATSLNRTRTRNRAVRYSEDYIELSNPKNGSNGLASADVVGPSSPTPVAKKVRLPELAAESASVGMPMDTSVQCSSQSGEEEVSARLKGNNINTRQNDNFSGSSSNSNSEIISSNKKVTYGRLTKKDVRFHKLALESGVLPEGTIVWYTVKGEKIREGKIKDKGILCSCCDKVLTASQFEACAGEAKRKKPYNYIYLDDGVSLHELSVRLSKERNLSNEENDDLCGICKDGGELLCCDLCPRAFHLGCVRLSSIPEGKWHCQFCRRMHQRGKCVEYNDNARAAGRVPGTDPVKRILNRCIRIVKTPENDLSSCVICRRHEFSTSEFGPNTVILCDQCEKEYHVGCLKAHGKGDLKELPEGKWFCCKECSKIYSFLHELVVRGAEPVQELDLDSITSKTGGRSLVKVANVQLKWRLLSGSMEGDENDLLLARALSIFHESFDPIIDSATGMDLIPPMVYGSNFSEDWDYRGMFCAVLIDGCSVISAALLRVFGSGLAELPLVATRRENEGMGCFRALFSCIEKVLISLKVKNLMVPAAEEAESIWTTKFGFKKVASKQLQGYAEGVRAMIFEGTSVLHKRL